MAVTPEEVRLFIEDANRARDNWLVMAEKSWNEIKKRQKNRKLWSTAPNAVKKRSRYPAWYSIFKIRQPLLLSRVGIPIGKDTTLDGSDHVGASAAFFLERLAVNLAKSFDFFGYCSSCRDDFLATNFGIGRAFYECREIKEKVKEYITPQRSETGDIVFVGASGEVIETDEIYQDDEGYFIYHEQTVAIEDEHVYLEPVLYKCVYVDPDINRWGRCRRLAFELYFSEPEFIEVFGTIALTKLAKPQDGEDSAAPKRQRIKVFEYWDDYEKDVYYLPELGSEFIEPKKEKKPYPFGDEEDEREEVNGLYDLEKFFPCPEPLLSNTSTDEFWPIPEYYQIFEILEDIHTIFSRMVALTRAIRARLLYDSSIEGLEQALHEASEGDTFGVTNLAQALSANGGTLDGVVQYIPVAPLVESLGNAYSALEQRLNTLYKLTGTSDLLQGLITDPTQRTFGERQMTEKYALNQIADPQRRMQEFVRGSYELLCEMALKNFKDASLDRYMIPQTAPLEHRNNYRAAIGMLKENRKRFRIELETDSTVALNEQYDKAMRIELVNAMTTALEKVAGIAQSSPALVAIELHALKFLLQGYRQGKLFQSETTEAIDNVIKQAEDAAGQQRFNKDEAMVKFQAQELEANIKIKAFEIQSNERIEAAKLQQNERIVAIENQLEAFKAQSANSQALGQLEAKYQEIQNNIALAQEELALKRDELMVEMQKVSGAQNLEQYRMMIDESVSAAEIRLKEAQQALEEQLGSLELQERVATEARLQSEHELQKLQSRVEMMVTLKDVMEQSQTRVENQAPTVNVHMPESKPRVIKRTRKIKRDAEDKLAEIEETETEELPTS